MTLFSAPNYCGEFDNAGGMMSVDETLMCSFQVNISASVPLASASTLTLLADPEAEREEGEISIPGAQQAPDPPGAPGWSSGWHEEKMSGVITGQLAAAS